VCARAEEAAAGVATAVGEGGPVPAEPGSGRAGEAGVVEAAGAAPMVASNSARSREREAIVQEILGRVRYLLTLKSRPPFGLAVSRCLPGSAKWRNA